LLDLLGGRAAGREPAAGRRRAPRRARNSLDRQLRRGIARRRAWLVVCVLVYLLPSGLGAAALLLAGMVVFYLAQKAEHWGRAAVVLVTTEACALVTGQLAWQHLFPRADLKLNTVLPAVAPYVARLAQQVTRAAGPGLAAVLGVVVFVVAAAVFITYLLLPAIAGALYATLRRLERDLVLRDAAVAAGTDSDEYLTALRQALDSRFEDVGLHLKYAEALFARGRVEQAAVEARVLLRQDPYNFNGNLLLANAYLALGLPEDCAAVCDAYLAVSGYCFEFGELRAQCQRRLGRP
jgi:hypothetical protein